MLEQVLGSQSVCCQIRKLKRHTPLKGRRMNSRRKFLTGMLCSSACLASPNVASSALFFQKSGDIRKIRFQNSNTGERVNTIYWIEGEYVAEALEEINYFMRDWRQNKVMRIDTANLDIISATQTLLDTVGDEKTPSQYDSFKSNELKDMINSSLHKVLNEREKDVIKKRFGIDEDQAFTLEEIGKEFNVTRERIRQIELKALKKLKKLRKSPVLSYLD